MIADERGNRVHPVDKQESIRMREYYAAHCPMTMREAYDIWAGKRACDGHDGDSLMSIGLRDGAERVAFFQWWAMMRFEYAEAMIKENRERFEGE